MEPITQFKGAYRFLSNFYPAPVRIIGPDADGANYATLEHAFQAAKTLDMKWRVKIWQAATPNIAKALGRKAPLRPGWDDMRNLVMLDLLRQKFAPGSTLGLQLRATGDALLVEGNTWHDNYWGSCTCPTCGNQGQNHLGRLLMRVRSER